jgi:hypothetical protein
MGAKEVERIGEENSLLLVVNSCNCVMNHGR